MKISMYEDVPNFGDVLNKYLWQPYLGEFLTRDDNILMLGIGTLLGHSKAHDGQVIVCGSGSGYGGDFSQLTNENWKIFFVRGPSTAKALGLPESMAITDPAILTPEIFPAGPKTGKTIFVPHWESSQNPLWKSACKLAGVEYVDPLSDIAEIMQTISGAKLVIAEAMHAAIIADAYRVPWVSVSTSSRINGFKWQDWASSLGMRHHFQHYAPLGMTNKVFNLTSGRADMFDTAHASSSGGEAAQVMTRRQSGGVTQMAKSVYKKVVPQSWQGGKDLEFFSSIAFAADHSINFMLKSGVYNKFFDQTVEDLRKSAAQTGMLSDDAIHHAKKEMLKERLESVRQYLAEIPAA